MTTLRSLFTYTLFTIITRSFLCKNSIAPTKEEPARNLTIF